MLLFLTLAFPLFTWMSSVTPCLAAKTSTGLWEAALLATTHPSLLKSSMALYSFDLPLSY